jgi:phosphopantothenoylcysteine decarboxylase/phosphopantothenate--cysteine ligase
MSEGTKSGATSVPNQPRKLLKKIVLAVTGSTGAASAIPRFLSVLRQMFAEEVVVVLSESAKHFVTPYVASLFSGQPAISEFYSTDQFIVPHIQCCESAEVLLVMPATANILAKVAHGIADEIVSATVLAAKCPVVFVPNMNESMWNKKATQRNVSQLREDGYHLINPTWGTEISNFEPVFGAMPAFPRILRELASIMGVSIEQPKSA